MGDAAGALRTATQALQPISDTARLDAELLMAHAAGISREDLLLHLPDLKVPVMFESLVKRRMTSEPVAHILGEKEFWGLPFKVSPDVLIPRPDSELLIEESLRLFHEKPPRQILDLGTGSGALLLAALSEFSSACGTGTDASAAALEVAKTNAKNLSLADRTTFTLNDWTQDGWQGQLDGRFNLILANPPYIATNVALSPEVAEFEPHEALFAGEAGLNDYKIIIPALGNLLAEAGYALLEIGFDQAESVSNLAQKYGYHAECKRDLGGNDRLISLRR